MDAKQAKQISELEQSAAFIAETLPPLWKRMFDNLKQNGFSEAQAFQLTLTYVHGQAGGKMVTA